MLSASSPYQTSSIDGKAIGVNFDELLDAQKVKKRCETKVSVKDTDGTPDHFKLYPNPANSEVRFVLENEGLQTEIVITDITGKKYLSKPFPPSGKLEVTINGFPKGIYIVHLNQNGRILESHKLVIN
ncbi:MAG: T9SS type A sorting domain-containing protein [Saprospiraceae bacterium]|nr:T9SS type A sorting domain-containing protein [Saprospiraceae bacterium]